MGSGNQLEICTQDSGEACCDLCRAEPRCNIWVYCPLADGCGPGLPNRECWLKHLVADPPDLANIPGKRGPGEGLQLRQFATEPCCNLGIHGVAGLPLLECWLKHLPGVADGTVKRGPK